jgi:CelD/BcsL family acetyltransferase involved in cellulose biosynthesis
VPVVAETIDDEDDLDGLAGEWDRLAVACSSPYSSPAWMRAWWRNARPDGARLQVVAVREGERLVGIAPLWRDGKLHRVLAARLSAPAAPLSEPGREREVAEAVAGALGGAVRLEGQTVDGWGETFAEAWPGRRPWFHETPPLACPQVRLEADDYDAWLKTKSSNFRSQARRGRRKIEKEGGRFAIVDADGFERARSAFLVLHGARWEARGGSKALVRGIEAMLDEAASELLPSGRFRAVTLEFDGAIVSSQLFVEAGGRLAYWNGGFDESAHRFAPAFQTLLFALEDAIGRGDTFFDLGPGEHQYKTRLADHKEDLRTFTILPRNGAYPIKRARMIPYQARWAATSRMSPDLKARLRRLARR